MLDAVHDYRSAAADAVVVQLGLMGIDATDDFGGQSPETSLIVGGLAAIALVVVGVIATKATNAANAIPDTVPASAAGGG